MFSRLRNKRHMTPRQGISLSDTGPLPSAYATSRNTEIEQLNLSATDIN